MSAAASASQIADVIVSGTKKAPQDIEAQAVANVTNSAEEHIETEFVKAIDDHLDDDLLPPLDLIVKLLKGSIPECVVAVKTRIDVFVSRLPCSGLLHVLIIEMMAVYIFYYSAYNALIEAVVTSQKYEKKDLIWPEAELVDKCLAVSSRKMLWMDGSMDSSDCFDATRVLGPYEEDVETEGSGAELLMGVINHGCLFLCCLLWFVVIGNFAWRNSCRVWVRYDSGAYLKCSYFTRRSFLYRYICGMIGLCASLTLASLIGLTASHGLLGWFIQHQLPNMLVVILSARAFIAPVKPKFEYKDLDQLNFKRPSFFQTNGAFATSLSNALIQCVRGEEFRKPLENLLAKPQDWQLALKLCLVSPRIAGNAHGVAQVQLPTLMGAARRPE